MAIYVPPSRRRRQVLLVGAAALIVGAVLGALAGRATAPSIGGRVRASQQRAVMLAAALRVVAIHQEADTASLQASADAGADMALRRAESGLKDALGSTPWITAPDKARLLGLIADLRAAGPGQASSPQFAQRVEAAASAIEAAFGVRETG